MRACHNCGFYSNGWCSYRDQGQNPGGGCSHWCSSSRVKGAGGQGRSRSGKGKSRPALGCGTCTWWASRVCKNPDSQAYGKKMTSGSLCTAYQHQKGDPLQYFPKRIIENAIERDKNRTSATVDEPVKRKAPEKKRVPAKSPKTTAPTSKKEPVPRGDSEPVRIEPGTRRREQGERCNTCTYCNNHVCNNKYSPFYGKTVLLTDWCEQFKRFVF